MTRLREMPVPSSGGDSAALLHAYQPDRTGSALDADTIWKAVLRSVALGGTGLVLAGSAPDVAAAFPRYGTSPIIIDSRDITALVQPSSPTGPSTQAAVVTLDAADQIREVLAALSLNKSQLAAVLRVSRPTLYGWLEGTEPTTANADRIDQICGLLRNAGVTGSSPLNARFVRRPVAQDMEPLVDLLSKEAIDGDNLAPLLRQAQDLSQAAADRRHLREARLRDLGYEESTDDEQREAIGRNIAALDWPK